VLRDRVHVDELHGDAIDVSHILAAIAVDGSAAADEGRA
jgi:galactofuranose transport system ATP-binding protein